MKIIIKEEQTELLGKAITGYIMLKYKKELCDVVFDSEPDDDGKFWVNLYFKEDWHDSLTNSVREVRIKSGEIRNDVYQFMGVDIRTGISLKNC